MTDISQLLGGSQIREVANGIQTLLSLFVILMFLWFIIERVVEEKTIRRSYWQIAAAIAIITRESGSLLRTLWVWYGYHAVNAGQGFEYHWMAKVPALPIAECLTAAGLLCMTRVFSPAAAPWAWWVGGMVAIAATIAGVFHFL